MEWYYAVNDQQQGPVTEEQLRQLLAQGAISGQTLVWREGMPDWQPYQAVVPSGSGQAAAPAAPQAGSAGNVICPTCGARTNADSLIPVGDKVVCPSCKSQYSQRLKEGGSVASTEKPQGTGGVTPVAQLRAAARECLNSEWGAAAGFIFVFWAMSFAINLVTSLIPIIGAFVPFVISGPFMLGVMTNMLVIGRGGASDFNNLFIGFTDFGRAFGVYALTVLIVLVPIFFVGLAAAMIIPAMNFVSESGDPNPVFIAVMVALGLVVAIVVIYIQLRFSLMYFLLVDNPHMGVIEVLKTSWAMMDGRILKLIWLYLTFFGWALLCLLTLGIGFIFLTPYISVTFARFYDDI